MFMERDKHKEFKELVRGQYMFFLDESTRCRAIWLLEKILEDDEDLSNSEYDAIIEELSDQLVYEVLGGNKSSSWWDDAKLALERLRNSDERKQGLSWLEIFDKYLQGFKLWDLIIPRNKDGVVQDILAYLEEKYKYDNPEECYDEVL